MTTARDVAEYFLFKAHEENELISHMKVQKLLYYAQGFHLAIFDRPLFDEEIEKWTHGPVVPDIYHLYKRYRDSKIPWVENFDNNRINEESRELIDEVYSVLGQFSAFALRNMTHSEPPWVNTENAEVIPPEIMKSYFKTRIKS